MLYLGSLTALAGRALLTHARLCQCTIRRVVNAACSGEAKGRGGEAGGGGGRVRLEGGGGRVRSEGGGEGGFREIQARGLGDVYSKRGFEIYSEGDLGREIYARGLGEGIAKRRFGLRDVP